MNFDEFIAAAWNDHADQPDAIADRLAASLAIVTDPAQLATYARLATHVYGEHLGQWQRGIDFLESLRGLPACSGEIAASAVATNVGALRYVGGDRSAVAALPMEEQVTALATAASAFVGRGDFVEAIRAYEAALAGSAVGLRDGSPALRALAIGGNNLALALEEKSDRSAEETRGMVVAAEGGLGYWKRAGTWLEEERALYRLAHSLLEAGQAHAALESARSCVTVCQAHNAPAFEHFFAAAVLALAQRAVGAREAFAATRAQALQWHAQVPENERQWCASDLGELED